MNPENLNVPNTNNPEKNSPQKQNENKIFLNSPIRTYEDDVKDVIKKDNISTTKILLAEQRKREFEQEETEETSIKSGRNIKRITISIILIVLGIGSVAGAYFYYNFQIKKQNEIIPPVLLKENEFMDVDGTYKINRTNMTGRETLGLIRNVIKNSETETADKNIKEIKIFKVVSTIQNNKEIKNEVAIDSNEFLNIIESRMPDQLRRVLDKNFFLGVYKKIDEIEPFIVFRVSDYEIAYNNMFIWENYLVKDIQDIFFQTLGSSQKFIGDNELNLIPNEIQATTTENGSSTNQIAQENKTDYNDKDFKDLILDNRDSRVIKNTKGDILFFYSFVDKTHLVMATNVETLVNVINRLNSAKLVR